MARSKNKKTLVGAVAESVTDAVTSAIDALAHPMRTVGLSKRKKVAKKATAKTANAKIAVKKAARKVTKKAPKRRR